MALLPALKVRLLPAAKLRSPRFAPPPVPGLTVPLTVWVVTLPPETVSGAGQGGAEGDRGADGAAPGSPSAAVDFQSAAVDRGGATVGVETGEDGGAESGLRQADGLVGIVARARATLPAGMSTAAPGSRCASGGPNTP